MSEEEFSVEEVVAEEVTDFESAYYSITESLPTVDSSDEEVEVTEELSFVEESSAEESSPVESVVIEEVSEEMPEVEEVESFSVEEEVE